MDKPRRFSGTHITIMVVALCLAVVGAPVAVAASTGSFVNITDPVTAAYKARVTPKGSLAVTPRDAVSGYNGRVDSAGRQLVTGPVTVGGKVSLAPGLPGTPVSSGVNSNGIVVPAGKHMVVETVSLSMSVQKGNSLIGLVHYTTGGVAAEIYVPLTFSYSDGTTYDHYLANTAVRLYADPGTPVFVEGSSPTATFAGQPSCTVSGYLI